MVRKDAAPNEPAMLAAKPESHRLGQCQADNGSGLNPVWTKTRL